MAANETDPLARPVHGTNPQNLIEYITRQKIYDSQFWKEECFGLTAADVTEKAARRVQLIGGVYGAFNKPTRFLCIVLKLLQIQPDEEIIEEWIHNEEFKYVQALGVFYARLTGRPHEIYNWLEPLLHDYRKLRFREPSEWRIVHFDEFMNSLLIDDRVCGIAMPRLPDRKALEEAGYLDGPRRSALGNLNREEANEMLEEMARDSCVLAIEAVRERRKKFCGDEYKDVSLDFKQDKKQERSASRSRSRSRSWGREQDERMPYNSFNEEERIHKKKKKKSKNNYGSLFKSSSHEKIEKHPSVNKDAVPAENTDEYWNEQRAKLGLKPLRK